MSELPAKIEESNSQLADTTTREAPGIETHEESDETRDMDVVGDDNPLVIETGESARERTSRNEGFGKFLGEDIYDHWGVFFREYNQNSETACLRTARLLLAHHEDYGEEWLIERKWIDQETGETVLTEDNDQQPLSAYEDEDDSAARLMETLRSPDEVIEAARDLGYDPTIEIEVYHDDQQIVWRDNGIGMTAREVDSEFNETFSSGSETYADTGGRWGVGALSYVPIAGTDAGMEIRTRTWRPDVPEYNHEGIRFYSYLGGYNAWPNDPIEDDFRGTEFRVPVQENVHTHSFERYVEEYSRNLRVPVLYREFSDGQCVTKEEYGGESVLQRFRDTSTVTIDRPGEFSIFTGPDLENHIGNQGYSSSDKPDTWLVSMKIDRNSPHNVDTLWDVGVQIHDEQGRIIAGPNRGRYSDGTTVFETREKENDLGKLDCEDIVLPQPTGDRDRLKSSSQNESFFHYIQELVTEAEIAQVDEFMEEMNDADHAGDVVYDRGDEWKLLRKIISQYGGYNVMSRSSNFKSFLNSEDRLPDLTDETIDQLWELYDTEVSYADKSNRGSITKKKSRSEKGLGKLLTQYEGENIYMAASTGGNFKLRFKVAHAGRDAAVIVVNGANKYGPYQEDYGFKKLKEVPLEPSDDHDYNIPEWVKEKQAEKKASKNSGGKPDKVEERHLSIRYKPENTSIDRKVTIQKLKELLDEGRAIRGRKYLILYPRSHEQNISDNYDMQKFAAISSATNEECEELLGYDRVFTPDQFEEFSKNTVIATDQGGIKAGNLVADDRIVIIFYAPRKDLKLILQDSTDKKRLRDLIKDKRISKMRNRDRDNRPNRNVVLGFADDKTLYQAAWAIREQAIGRIQHSIVGMRNCLNSPEKHTSLNWKRSHDLSKLKKKAKTPQWDNDSEVYRLLFNANDVYKPILRGFHDAEIDPTELSEERLRKLIGATATLHGDDGS